MYSAAKSVAVSLSIDWVIVTIWPIDMSLAIISLALRFILRAKSLMETVSMMSMDLGTSLTWVSAFFWLS